MSDIDERNQELFSAEACELLAELESSLLELEASPDDKSLLRSIFRVLHTIKGSGSMFGFHEIALFAHKVETIFELVRSGEIPVTRELIDLTFSAADYIRSLLGLSSEKSPASDLRAEEIVSRIDVLLSRIDSQRKGGEFHPDERIPETPREAIEKNAVYRIRFGPAAHIFKKGINPIPMLDELRRLGKCEIVAITDGIPNLEQIDPEACYISWDIVLLTDKGINAIKDVFIFVEDDCELRIDVVSEDTCTLNETGCRKLGEILVDRQDLTTDDIENILREKKRIGEMLVEHGLVSNQKVTSALAEQGLIKDVIHKYQQIEAVSSVRVPSRKLDELVDLVGELVTVQVRLSQTSVHTDNPEILSISEEIERLTGALRDSTMSMRMLPIGATFSKLKRLVRDLSHELGKDVQLITDGADTELDKTMIEKLNDPLVHIIRNSIGHGIEKPEVRLSAGKAKTGEIRLSAFHSGSHVLIQIKDDGKGLDQESIYRRALERGIITEDRKLSGKELTSLILSPGFSTAEEVTSVSGRGVGLDVVRKAMETLKGSIEIEGTNGVGTTITLTLPLTLAIIEGLLVRIAKEYFVLPLHTVEECVELTPDDLARSHGRHVANIRGQIIPYIRLKDRFAVKGETPAVEYIVITENEGARVGMVVDQIIGEHQTVLKSLNRIYRHVKEISGATILGNGKVALVIDVPKLIHEYERYTTSTYT